MKWEMHLVSSEKLEVTLHTEINTFHVDLMDFQSD